MALDLMGNITLALSVATLFLLIVGLPLARSLKNAENFVRHGYLTIVAFVIQTITVLIVMIPSFQVNFNSILALDPMSAVNTWLHVLLGVFAEVSAVLYIGVWLAGRPSKMRCVRFKKYMPTFVTWLIAIVTGALIHLLQLF